MHTFRSHAELCKSSEKYDGKNFPVPKRLAAKNAPRFSIRIEFPADLPVVGKRDDLARAIRDNQVVIVCGEPARARPRNYRKYA